MVYKGENMLVIESKTQAGCRVLLNRSDLIQLQYLEWCIVETVVRKSTIIRPVLKQFNTIGNYLDQEYTNVKSPPKSNEEMIVFIKNLSDDKIIGYTPKEETNFISELKINSITQLAEHWAQRWNGEPELFFSLPRYSSMSPIHEDLSQARAADEDLGIEEFLTQATWVPTQSLPVPGGPPTIQAGDENDGPTFFNHSPFILGGKPTKKRNAKRKLFLNDII